MSLTHNTRLSTLKETTEFLHAAAAAKSLQSCPTLCDPIDGSPPGSTMPGILQARTLEWVAISFYIEPFNFSFFSITGQGIDLDYHDIEWFALETNRDHSVVLRLHPSTAFWTLLLTMMATPFLLRDSCPQ